MATPYALEVRVQPVVSAAAQGVHDTNAARYAN